MQAVDGIVRPRRRHDDQVDVARQACRRERLSRRRQREVGRRLPSARRVAGDAGARAHPLVTGLDAPAHEVVVGEHLGRQVVAGAGDAAMRMRHLG
jgi:hypothetical protein